MRIWMLCVAAALSAPVAVRAETLTNQMVIALAGAGIGDEAIVAKIRNSGNQFDLSTEKLIELKSKGVSSPVIAAMIQAGNGSPVSGNAAGSSDSPDPLVPHPSGIYLLVDRQGAAHMVRMDPTVSNQTKTGGILGYAFTGGIVPISMKAVLPNVGARVRTTAGHPVFYFYFDEANRSLSQGGPGGMWLAGPAAAVTSPNEFSLVRFDVKKNTREAKVGKFNIGGAKAGVMDNDRIAFSYDQVAPGVFRVAPEQDLPPGEYGFLYSMGGGTGMGMQAAGSTSRVFDFAVTQ